MITTGFTSLDQLLTGWHPANLIIAGARPVIGKTAFALNMAWNLTTKHRIPVAYFSLEMNSQQCIRRLLINEFDKIAKNEITDNNEIDFVINKITELINAPLYIDDTSGLSISGFQSKAYNLVQNYGVKLIIVDYLQLMDGLPNTFETRGQEMTDIVKSLKRIAQALNIPIIATSQLNRGVENRRDKRPRLIDLCECKVIGENADVVCFIHRPEYYHIYIDEYGKDVRGIAEIIIAKNDNGPTGSVRMRFDSSELKFYDID